MADRARRASIEKKVAQTTEPGNAEIVRNSRGTSETRSSSTKEENDKEESRKKAGRLLQPPP